MTTKQQHVLVIGDTTQIKKVLDVTALDSRYDKNRLSLILDLIQRPLREKVVCLDDRIEDIILLAYLALILQWILRGSANKADIRPAFESFSNNSTNSECCFMREF
jgi:hypothetical protein